MKLSELFTVTNGVPTTGLTVHPNRAPGRLAFLRPSNSIRGTLAGYVDPESIPATAVFPAETLFVSTNGEGSHTFAYVAPMPFSCNSDVAALIPNHPLTLPQKLYYALAITANRWLFSYGRKPKGARLGGVVLPGPAELPDWVDGADLGALLGAGEPAREAAPLPDLGKMPLQPLANLFNISPGNNLALNRLVQVGPGEGIPFISRKMGDNGVAAYVLPVKGIEPNPAGELTCALSGNGVLSTFIQDRPYYTGYHIARLAPKRPMSRPVLMFYCGCIMANRFRYSFGRQANRTLAQLRLPVPPDGEGWEAIEAYMEGLPFTSQL